jgi:hypothetical protein
MFEDGTDDLLTLGAEAVNALSEVNRLVCRRD